MKRLLGLPMAALAASVGLAILTTPSSASGSASASGPDIATTAATTAEQGITAERRVRVCHGHRATIVDRKRGGHAIKGTRHRDVIWAGGGHDVVFGGKGRDLICGGKGADILNGMKGRRERIYGGKGADMCIAPRREHRFHSKCDVHSLPKPPPPPTSTSTRAFAEAARATKRTAAVPAQDAAQAAGFTGNVGTIHCDAGSQGPFYRPIDVTATGGISGVVSVVPLRHTWVGGSDPWGPGVVDAWQTFTVPTDGLEYVLPMERYYLPTGLDTHYVGYYFLWWTDDTMTELDDWAFGWVTYYSGGFFPTQNNGVCQPIGAGLIG